jgi:hypothetical protein
VAKRMLMVVLAVATLGFGLAGCTRGEATTWWGTRELGATELDPQPYMISAGLADHPNPGVRMTSIGFWCDEFVVEMMRRAGHQVASNGEPQGLAEQFPLAAPPWQPGDLVFVTYNASRPQQRYDHVGILQHADGDHLWVLDGNWPTGQYKANGKALSGVVLNERWVGDGAVTEVRRP